MASYKVIQDIEAEDKLVGPLTLRQFIYGCIAAVCAYLSFLSLAHNFSIALIILLPPMLFTGFFAFPWGRDQPTEVWALAKIRFYIMSRKRIWNQSGVKDLVNITAPKRDTRQYTNGLSTGEVQNRLSALANTLDTRGWAVKNVFITPQLIDPSASDRLLDVSNLPREVSNAGVTDADDILDVANNLRAQRLEQMVSASTQSHKQQLLDHMRQGSAPTLPAPQDNAGGNYWFIENPARMQPAVPPLGATTSVTNVGDAVLEKRLRDAEASSPDERTKTLAPLNAATSARTATSVAQSAPVTPAPDPVTMKYANNDDLNIATIARLAHKDKGDGEVVISLHGHD